MEIGVAVGLPLNIIFLVNHLQNLLVSQAIIFKAIYYNLLDSLFSKNFKKSPPPPLSLDLTGSCPPPPSAQIWLDHSPT